jgi:hypothetical protein
MAKMTFPGNWWRKVTHQPESLFGLALAPQEKGQENLGIDAGLADAVDGSAKLFDSSLAVTVKPNHRRSRFYCPRQARHDVVVGADD